MKKEIPVSSECLFDPGNSHARGYRSWVYSQMRENRKAENSVETYKHVLSN